jgi:hypothetical protein
MPPTGRARKSRAARSGPRALRRGGELRVRFRMRLPSVTLAGLAFLELNAQHAGPEAKGLLGVIGRKLHQGDRMPRHRVKTHTRRIVALDHRRPNLAVRVRRHIRAADPLSCARRTLRELESGPRRPSGRSASPSDLLSTRAPRLRCAGARGSRRSTPEPLLAHARPAPRRQRGSGDTRWSQPVAAFLGTEQQHPAGRARQTSAPAGHAPTNNRLRIRSSAM